MLLFFISSYFFARPKKWVKDPPSPRLRRARTAASEDILVFLTSIDWEETSPKRSSGPPHLQYSARKTTNIFKGN
jgi:hypothetical protein